VVSPALFNPQALSMLLSILLSMLLSMSLLMISAALNPPCAVNADNGRLLPLLDSLAPQPPGPRRC
jgi:hypothetical protein